MLGGGSVGRLIDRSIATDMATSSKPNNHQQPKTDLSFRNLQAWEKSVRWSTATGGSSEEVEEGAAVARAAALTPTAATSTADWRRRAARPCPTMMTRSFQPSAC